ncbi:MAG: carboxylating nicotinate-nucleotide diphosphorylase [Bacteroidetes bacterium]|nr:carboxylating nicotinate-nucleotide diphosphorylase [Bacteroidota bacterium]
MKLPNYITPKALNSFIVSSLLEDIGDGDHTSLACIPKTLTKTAKLLVKENGVIAGVELAKLIFKIVDKNLTYSILKNDGSTVKKGDVVLTVNGSAQSILKAERLVLNCMQRMSGIATTTATLTAFCKKNNVKLLDTRKTTPGFRMMEKWAVAIGGGVNHRFGLFDMILIKDNHIDYCGSITKAIKSSVDYLKKKNKKIKIEVEVRSLNDVQEVLSCGYKVDRILLDNFSPKEITQAVKLINKRIPTEASGNINAKNLASYAKTGVNYISMGALTHSIKSLDLSLKATANAK